MLRRWDLNAILTPEQLNQALRQLAALRHRHNLTFADATDVAPPST